MGLRGQFVFNPSYLLLGLSSIFLVIELFVAYLSAKGYLITGSLTLLFITISFFLISIIGIMNGYLATLSPNWGVTVFAVGFLVFAVLQFSSSFQASFRSRRLNHRQQHQFRSVPFGSEHRKIRLTLACSLAMIAVATISLLTVLNVFPTFFINGVGVTLTDQAVYSIIVVLLSLSAVLFLRQYLKSKSTVLYWYTLALVLDAIGSFGLTLQARFSDIVVWTGRLGLYVAAIYFLIALLSTKKENNEV